MAQLATSHQDMSDPRLFVLYRYHPSLPAAIVFVTLFLLTTTMHILQAAKHRTAFFIPFIIGGIFECTGYVGRVLAHSNEYSLGIYITQTLLLLVAPALFAASIYMFLARLILFTTGEASAPISARWLTMIFVSGDILSFLVQSAGAGLMASVKTLAFGKQLVVTGLMLQIVFFGMFIVTSGTFHLRMVRSPSLASVYRKWGIYMYTLYTASVLILVRSIFRVVEFSDGNNGFLLGNEVFLYVFDAVLMLGVMLVFSAIHPSMIIGRKARGRSIQMNERQTSGASEIGQYERKPGASFAGGGATF